MVESTGRIASKVAKISPELILGCFWYFNPRQSKRWLTKPPFDTAERISIPQTLEVK